MKYYLTIEVEIQDPQLLLAAATAHGAACGYVDKITKFEDALVMLLDPGSGGAQYTGDLAEAGIEIVESSAEPAQ